MSKHRTLFLLALWLALGLAAAILLYELEPNGPLKWLLWLVAGPPIYLLLSGICELIGEAFCRLPGIKQGNAFVEQRTKGNRTSVLRILWYLFISLIAVALILISTWLVVGQNA
jgi:hypothetical protein